MYDIKEGGVSGLKPLSTCMFLKVLFNKSLTTSLFLFLVIAVIQGCSTDSNKTVQKEPASDFTLELFNGELFHLNTHKGKPVVINFWASWCIPCREEMPVLEKAYKEYKKKGVVFIGISVQDTETKAREFVKEFQVSFPTGIDMTGVIRDSYRVYGLPTTFFIDREGKIDYLHVGGVNEELLKYELEKLL